MRSSRRITQDRAQETRTGQRAAPHAWMSWAESLALPATLTAIGALIDRHDPFLLQRGFSWLTLSPLLAGLQHGSSRGLATAALQALLVTAAWKSGLAQVPGEFAEIVLGWFLAG